MTVSPEGARPDADRFELRGELGAGGMGVVYRVFDRRGGGEVALKVLGARTGLDLYRFKREFRSLADLRHPNLVELHELFAVLDEWMFTMELIDGVPFDQWVRPAGPMGPLDEAHLRDALGQVADGLAALHAAGKVHRDVKPSNVLVDRGGRAVLLDFGLIVGVEELITPTHDAHAVGTPQYMSPEQVGDLPLTGATDLYSVGVMLYEALTGRRPFDGPRSSVLARKLSEDPLEPSRLAQVPRDLEELCMKLLAREPAARPDALSVLEVLGREPSPATRAIMAPATRWPRRDAELAALHQALADSRDHFVVVFVNGSSGSGKTALIDDFRAELGGDAVVLAGRAAARESLPYRVTDHMVDQLSTWLLGLPREQAAALMPHGVAALTRVFPVLQRVPAAQRPLLPGAAPLDPDELRRQAANGLVDLFRNIAATRPLVLVGDDTQWSPASGAAVMSRFDAADAPRALLIVVHRREVSESPTLEALGRWRGDLRRIELP